MRGQFLAVIVCALVAGCSTLITESTPDTVIVDVRGRNDAMRQEAWEKANGACQQYGKVAYKYPQVHDRGWLQDGAHYILQFDCVKPSIDSPGTAQPPPNQRVGR